MIKKVYEIKDDTLIFDNDLTYINKLYNEDVKKVRFIDLSNNLIAIGTETFKDFKNIIKVDFSSTLKTIGPYAFFNCYNLRCVDLEKTAIDNIKTGAFSYCNIEDLRLSNSLKFIGVEAFSNNIFSYLLIPNSVEYIAPFSFKGCQMLEKVDCSINTNISSKSFDNCISLRSINFYNDESLEYEVHASNDEYIKNVETILNGVIITVYNQTTASNTIYIYCNKKEYVYNEIYTVNDGLSKFLKSENDIKIFNKSCALIRNTEINLQHIDYFNGDLEKIYYFINYYNLYRELSCTYYNKEASALIAMLDDLKVFEENSLMKEFLQLLIRTKDLEKKSNIILYLKVYKTFDIIENTQLICDIDFNVINEEKVFIDKLMMIPQMMLLLDDIINLITSYNFNILEYKSILKQLAEIFKEDNKARKLVV